MSNMSHSTAEQQRLDQANSRSQDWKCWGPYLSERQWGTVREDYSPHGNAWEYFPHDHARSRAYRWGEDGIAGISDAQCRLCLSLALWNGEDPILKERLFGLTNSEGNHGEDVKELYYYQRREPFRAPNLGQLRMVHHEHSVPVQRTESMRMQLVNGDRSLGEGARKGSARYARAGPAQRASPTL
jgi:hypothetical protein